MVEHEYGASLREDHTMQGSSVETLIEAQRRCSVSPKPFERVVGSLLMAARLQKKLAVLSDSAIGHLMIDYIWNELNLFSPEMVICKVATLRLIDSSSVVKTEQENHNQ